jgi:hypothetical protein
MRSFSIEYKILQTKRAAASINNANDDNDLLMVDSPMFGYDYESFSVTFVHIENFHGHPASGSCPLLLRNCKNLMSQL